MPEVEPVLCLAPLQDSWVIPSKRETCYVRVAWARRPWGGDEEENRRHDPAPDWARG